MGFFDKLTGTKYPDNGAAPCSAEEVRAALLAINGRDVPFRVRNALPDEKADLVAEWRVLEPATGRGSTRRQLERSLKTRIRLAPGRREVRSIDEQWQVTLIGDPPRRSMSRAYGRGRSTTVSRRGTYERATDGRRRRAETFRLDTREMSSLLQQVVLDAGWIWRGVLFSL
ncbi:hypothetical protein [Streptomyces sp. NPDC006333]|uniref:hypothetical protein n=1 Tax=Streptomyces sp. NPDC006333 TaxID=3156753 RepID=UPI0033A1A4DE